MKAENLMIGDWVYDKNGLYTPVTMRNLPYYATFNPIPLTAEILKNNGFNKEKEDYVDYICYVSQDERIIIYEDSNTPNKDWHIHVDNEDMQSIGSADVQYVHEMQHLYRLCNIDKEIRL